MHLPKTAGYLCVERCSLTAKIPCLLGVACILVLIIVRPVQAQEYSSLYLKLLPSLPETILVPIKSEQNSQAGSGWMLTYRNGYSPEEAMDREVQSRDVTWLSNNQLIDGLISWEIIRTRNSACTDSVGGPCPDTIRVLSVPHGFVVVPSIEEVKEGAARVIFIVPAGVI